MKITKFFTLFLLFLTITIVLSGCNKDVEHKKNISIKDIINDKNSTCSFQCILMKIIITRLNLYT